MPTHVCLLYEAMWVGHMTIKLAGQFDFWVEIFITCWESTCLTTIIYYIPVANLVQCTGNHTFALNLLNFVGMKKVYLLNYLLDYQLFWL